MTAAEALALVQGTPEWRQARAGNITASRAKDAIDMKKPVKNKPAEETQKRADYRTEIICERLTGAPYPRHVTWEMQWGIDHEADARTAYELDKGVFVDQVGFVMHPTIARFGCSPDGFVGEKGMVQFKCPTTATHVEWWQKGIVPVEHIPQLAAELSCNPERDWIDFCSFDPRLPEWLQLFIRRFERNGHSGTISNASWIATLESEIVHFDREIDQTLRLLPAAPQPIAQLLEMPRPDEMQIGEF